MAIPQIMKKPNATSPPKVPAIAGNDHEIAAANAQWVSAPKDCPRARIAVGKISETNTQITAPASVISQWSSFVPELECLR
ncbi:hypothetical protein BH23ACT6_BH23ACT6_20270 [soil metagenome]